MVHHHQGLPSTQRIPHAPTLSHFPTTNDAMKRLDEHSNIPLPAREATSHPKELQIVPPPLTKRLLSSITLMELAVKSSRKLYVL